MTAHDKLTDGALTDIPLGDVENTGTCKGLN